MQAIQCPKIKNRKKNVHDPNRTGFITNISENGLFGLLLEFFYTQISIIPTIFPGSARRPTATYELKITHGSCTWYVPDEPEGEDDLGNLRYGGERVLQENGRQSLLVLRPGSIRPLSVNR